MNPIYVDAGKLDVNQKDIYDLRLDTKFIVKGCAGSGKTSLALLRIKQLLVSESEEGETPFYYITFVRELVECMRKEIGRLPDIQSRFNDYAITYENWKTGVITDWCRCEYHIISRPAMESQPVCDNGRLKRPLRINKSPDYLFVDECQDLEIGAIESLLAGARKGIGFYGDDDQHIMAWGERCPVTLKTVHDRFDIPIHELIFNYRLPKEIAMFAEQVEGRPDLSRHCKSQFHEKPFVIKVKDCTEANDFMMKRISNLGLQDVGVAYTTNEQVRSAHDVLVQNLGATKVSASWEVKPSTSSAKGRRGKEWSHLRDTPVKIMTYQKIKGQQFETVFVFLSGELTPEMVKWFYVGITRAERFLYVLYEGSMPSILRQVPISLYNTTDEVCAFNNLYRGTPTQVPGNKVSGTSIDVGF